jgi:hypothetical protein
MRHIQYQQITRKEHKEYADIDVFLCVFYAFFHISQEGALNCPKFECALPERTRKIACDTSKTVRKRKERVKTREDAQFICRMLSQFMGS